MQKVRVCTLFSGSSANSVFIEVGGRGILIDAGANITRCRESLESVGSSFEKITAVFSTALDWTGTVAATIAANPMLLLCVVLGFIGTGVLLFKRFLRL